MRCVICHGDEIKVTEEKEEVKIANDIVYVPVKIPICNNCGERYYDRRTMQFLEEIEKRICKKRTELKEVGKVLIYS